MSLSEKQVTEIEAFLQVLLSKPDIYPKALKNIRKIMKSETSEDEKLQKLIAKARKRMESEDDEEEDEDENSKKSKTGDGKTSKGKKGQKLTELEIDELKELAEKCGLKVKGNKPKRFIKAIKAFESVAEDLRGDKLPILEKKAAKLKIKLDFRGKRTPQQKKDYTIRQIAAKKLK